MNWDSLIGVLIGSALTLVATYWSHKLQMKTQEAKDKELLKSLLQSIHDEVETLWDSYMDGAGKQVDALPDGQPLNMYYPITQDYFTIYNTNAFLIGRIPDPDLRKTIVVTYAKARALIDTFRMNNDLVQKHEYAYWMWQETKNLFHQQHAQARYEGLVRYAPELKKRHEEIKKITQDLLRTLRKEGVLNKPVQRAR